MKKRPELIQLDLFEHQPAPPVDIVEKRKAEAYAAGRSLGLSGVERCGKTWNETLAKHNGDHTDHYMYDDSAPIRDEFCRGYFEGFTERMRSREAVQRRGGVRYLNPETGETWTGRGLRPMWVRQELERGRRLEEFEQRLEAA